MPEMFNYNMDEVETIPPKRTGKRKSKYDSILNDIIKSPHKKGKLEFPDVPEKKVTYYRNQVKKRIDKRNLKDSVEVYAIGNCIYFKKK